MALMVNGFNWGNGNTVTNNNMDHRKIQSRSQQNNKSQVNGLTGMIEHN